jgi:hypothetical protein
MYDLLLELFFRIWSAFSWLKGNGNMLSSSLVQMVAFDHCQPWKRFS